MANPFRRDNPDSAPCAHPYPPKCDHARHACRAKAVRDRDWAQHRESSGVDVVATRQAWGLPADHIRSIRLTAVKKTEGEPVTRLFLRFSRNSTSFLVYFYSHLRNVRASSDVSLDIATYEKVFLHKSYCSMSVSISWKMNVCASSDVVHDIATLRTVFLHDIPHSMRFSIC